MISKKVCLLGDYAVGKTSLVRQFVYSLFDDRYISTIGVKVSRKTIVVPQQGSVVELNMMLWDLAGSEEFSTLRASYLRGTAGAILVCDLTRVQTLDSLAPYAAGLYQISPGVPIIVAANKRDLVEGQQVTAVQVEQAAAAIHAPYYLTSAKTGQDVEAMFRHLGRLLLA
ncbi:MAG: GTP-binding protein [Anaerolineae bacterium]|nr:GTP-binding protein [Anaerolineae bacterium]